MYSGRHSLIQNLLKKQGCFFEYEQERNKDLLVAFHATIGAKDLTGLDEVWERISTLPSARFWVTGERAAIVVSRIIRGDKLLGMRELKREMFFEIYKRVQKLQTEKPHLSLVRICDQVVKSPAPKFYMTPDSVRVIIYKIKRGWYQERKQKLRFLY